MHIYKQIKKIIYKKTAELIEKKIINDTIQKIQYIAIEIPKKENQGDFSTNAAMILSGNNMENAKIIAEEIKNIDLFSAVNIAQPGFINLTIKEQIWLQEINNINEQGINFGTSSIGSGIKINLEFVSANPTGPMHIGHARGAIFSDVLANLLKKTSHIVTKEYYINDTGKQIEQLVNSVKMRYVEILGQTIEKPQYPGEYLKPIANKLFIQHGTTLLENPDCLEIIKNHTVNELMHLIKNDLKKLGVEYDVFVSESFIHKKGLVNQALQLLKNKNLIYKGTLPEPKGKADETWEPREQLLFKSTEFGDDIDRALQKSDKSWTYFASDVGYHLYKYQRGFTNMIVELGKDHSGYVKRIKAIVKAISDNKAEISVICHNLVNFYEKGNLIKMSKRSGNMLTVSDVLQKVGRDVTRFMLLTRNVDITIDFDLTKATEQSYDNPIFYVQYAYARIESVLEKIKNTMPRILEQINAKNKIDENILKILTYETEIKIIKKLSLWPFYIEKATIKKEPHHICFYLQELAKIFHSYWHHGSANNYLKIINEENIGETLARTALIKNIQIVIESGLDILGIKPTKNM